MLLLNTKGLQHSQGDLEDIEQEVEEQIQIATANGEFDNVEGTLAFAGKR